VNVKELLIILRPEKALATEEILLSHGAIYVARHSVSGRGKEVGQTLKHTWLGIKSKSYASIRKSMISALIEEKALKKILPKLIEKNRTNQFGDGRIFVLPSTA
jgi:nitrogen regulatory protein PII 2